MEYSKTKYICKTTHSSKKNSFKFYILYFYLLSYFGILCKIKLKNPSKGLRRGHNFIYRTFVFQILSKFIELYQNLLKFVKIYQNLSKFIKINQKRKLKILIVCRTRTLKLYIQYCFLKELNK